MNCDYGTGPGSCASTATHRVHWGEGIDPNVFCETHTAPIYEDQEDPLIGHHIKIRKADT